MTGFWGILTGFVGIIFALAITAGAIYVVRRPLARFLEKIIDDREVAALGVTFILLLLGLDGLEAVLGYFTQANLNTLFDGLVRLLNSLAGTVQWAAYIGALLFIAMRSAAASWRDGNNHHLNSISTPARLEWSRNDPRLFQADAIQATGGVGKLALLFAYPVHPTQLQPGSSICQALVAGPQLCAGLLCQGQVLSIVCPGLTQPVCPD